MSSSPDSTQTQPDPPNLTPRLYDAAIKGDVNSLHSLIREDPLILNRCIFKNSDGFTQSPLHVSASLGHLDFTTRILCLKPDLAKQLDQSNRSSALHLASGKGHLDIVKKLVEVNPSMCLSRDQDGRNPVHIAAINNQLQVLKELVCMNPLNAARQRTNDGETLLHLCVNYAQLDCLEYLVKAMGELLNAKDNDGNTVLHLAVLAKKPEAVEMLITNKKMEHSAINKNGLTAIECLSQDEMNSVNTEIHRICNREKVHRPKHVGKQRGKDEQWLKEQRTTLMVVASLIAGMAFQVGVNLPQSIGQLSSKSDLQNGISPSPSPSADSVGGTNDRTPYWLIIMANTISMASSLSVVLLLISGLPCERLFVIVLMICMWVAVCASLFTYVLSVMTFLISSWGCDFEGYELITVSAIMVLTFLIWVAVLLLGHFIRFSVKMAKKLVQAVKKTWRPWINNNGLNSNRLPQFVNL